MGYKILRKEELIPGQTTMLVIDAPQIAAKAKPGNFVMMRTSSNGERVPLTIADCDKENGTITIVYLVVGKSTAEMNTLSEGDEFMDVCGPLGKATHIKQSGTVVCVGGGTGIAAMHHIAKGHVEAGNRVIAIVGARSKDLLLFCSELSSFCPELRIATDDGSEGHKGFVTEILQDILETEDDVAEVVAIGPVPMMEAVCRVTEPFGTKTTVSLNSIMVDGIGMCGACRCTVGGKTLFACVDGPEFDGHKVDFGELKARLWQFKQQEGESMERFSKECQCNG
ncbi:sulfide/dihydroorotate dehydrogenase-like FAD/NAD-binding protein [Pseudodesulfovibrio piezophilus]|uniref:Putative dihydroorotate dehydrogenase electron transfer subunit n=1 Tax=Pseudodesulfovibrio piezophilus (strain DSM 21447 / JCM 15486 / C1TLV30) TaxID=1322246 RepID=M1WWM8_PSEP2|nr:sulfide/dihydroorotate dehydrogenase-like FAD/NAD-binding protein [Pseudodesulfovibrio piezophilus]CCH49223.1 putative dihydroorotate dehydrogenase electron transfer subunit [Pseudodesulfovibrio piezophilus C1TLV30]